MGALSAAVVWHHMGVSCIPILAGKKVPAIARWREFQERLPTAAELYRWFVVDYNLAVLTGGSKNLVVIDWDDFLECSRWVATVSRAHIADVLTTYRVRSARGWHFYFYSEERVRSHKFEKVDIKADGGYVLSPPSVHPSGAIYLGFGRRTSVVTVSSVRALLGDWWIESEYTASECSQRQEDPLDAAMRDAPDLRGLSIPDILRRIDLVALAESAGARFSKRGREFRSPCPLHGGDNPTAFVIYDDGDKQRWRCFTNCPHPASGDAVDFYARWKGISVESALSELAERYA